MPASWSLLLRRVISRAPQVRSEVAVRGRLGFPDPCAHSSNMSGSTLERAHCHLSSHLQTSKRNTVPVWGPTCAFIRSASVTTGASASEAWRQTVCFYLSLTSIPGLGELVVPSSEALQVLVITTSTLAQYVKDGMKKTRKGGVTLTFWYWGGV